MRQLHDLPFADPQPDVKDIAAFRRWQSAFGVGWIPLVNDLHRNPEVIAPGYRMLQIKEKFGSPTVYIDHPDLEARRRADSRILEAKAESATVCDICGRPGTPFEPGSAAWRAAPGRLLPRPRIGIAARTRCRRHIFNHQRLAPPVAQDLTLNPDAPIA